MPSKVWINVGRNMDYWSYLPQRWLEEIELAMAKVARINVGSAQPFAGPKGLFSPSVSKSPQQFAIWVPDSGFATTVYTRLCDEKLKSGSSNGLGQLDFFAFGDFRRFIGSMGVKYTRSQHRDFPDSSTAY